MGIGIEGEIERLSAPGSYNFVSILKRGTISCIQPYSLKELFYDHALHPYQPYSFDH